MDIDILYSENHTDLKKWRWGEWEAIWSWLSSQRQTSRCVLSQCGLKSDITKCKSLSLRLGFVLQRKKNTQKSEMISASFGFQNTLKYCPCEFIASYQDLESVKKRGSICQAAILLVSRAVLGNVAICTSAEEDLLNATGEGVTQVLDWVHHHTAINRGA